MTRTEFINFLIEFRQDLIDNNSNWENQTLEDFLEAMKRYTNDVQGYYDNMKMDIDADVPSWENFKVILMGASIYE
jgi:deoxyadenosine/deoxycytidine kinase